MTTTRTQVLDHIEAAFGHGPVTSDEMREAALATGADPDPDTTTSVPAPSSELDGLEGLADRAVGIHRPVGRTSRPAASRLRALLAPTACRTLTPPPMGPQPDASALARGTAIGRAVALGRPLATPPSADRSR
ncbi:hypothetical protein O2W18_12315 [Modestobacter sp. VKM Ac-2983]|uniref:hypothetical protein n=1 Tax=Modestobacter sp. VKM Ac-2983 TaxID=3004137 RepID=UPI0022AB5B60|nr:hypothetical protein [Modestobacter sp. VKM Ac-2983]MCZ2805892.1 hypothetical protein [Modestobacter sp. VKM Ac-2983]